MVLPNFIGIGAQRAATTWAYNCLREHPDVFMPAKKELHYFDEEFHRGPSWYTDHFKDWSGQKAIGEITPNYLDVEAAMPLMAEFLPDARLFVILREPVDRAYSAYKLFDRFHDKTFAEAIKSSGYLVDLGLYAKHLTRVFQYYSMDRVRIYFYEDIQADPTQFLVDLYGYAGVDTSFRPASISKVYNRIVFPRAQKLVDKVGLTWALRAVRRTPLGEWIKRKHATSSTANGKAELAPDTVRELRQLFRADVLRLQEMVGRDLSAWL